MLNPQFSQSQITKTNTKSKYGKNRQKGYDGDEVDDDTDEYVTDDADDYGADDADDDADDDGAGDTGDADDDADDADDDVKEECVLLNFRHSDKLTLVSCLSVAKTKYIINSRSYFIYIYFILFLQRISCKIISHRKLFLGPISPS